MSRKKIDPTSVNLADREQLLAYVRQLPKTKQDFLWVVTSQLKYTGPQAMAYLYGVVDQVGDENMLRKDGLPASVAQDRARSLAMSVGREASPNGGEIK